jgi:integrase
VIPVFGEMLPSKITPLAVKQYRRRIHEENEHIRAARNAGTPLRDPRTGQPLRPLSNGSINKTLRTLALILDEEEDAGWITRNVARGRRTCEPVERQRRDALEPDELLSLLEAASQLDGQRHRPETLAKAREVRALRDGTGVTWAQIGARVGVSETSAIYLYGCNDHDGQAIGRRRAVIATLAFTGLRVSELCALNRPDIDLSGAKIRVRDAKTEAGVRVVDIRPRLVEELTAYFERQLSRAMDAPAFPTPKGTRRDRNNISRRVIGPVIEPANASRVQRDQPPILIAVTPHTFRRTYITFMLAAGFDLPYVQDQVGHTDPITTIGIYARVIRRADRDLRAELRELFGEHEPTLGLPTVLDLAARRRELERSEQRRFER